MESVREGYATAPTDICIQINPPETITSSNSSLSLEEESQAIPSGLIKYKWQLILGDKATLPEILHSIEQCKALVLETESGSEERKWVVRHLVELRLCAEELKDALEDPNLQKELTKVILGHHFKLRQQAPTTRRQHCDHCSGTIWSVVQASYICTDCGFCCHHKCVGHILRVCANVIVTEMGKPIIDICPEKGLASQFYKCFECKTLLINKNLDPRLCDYTGNYYCSTCHWNSEAIIPARVIQNWDFEPRPVSQSSLQVLNLFYNRPVIDLQRLNPRLLDFVPELSVVKKNREDLVSMMKYITACRKAQEDNLIQHITGKRHLVEEFVETKDSGESPESYFLYSMSDLEGIFNGSLNNFLIDLREKYRTHIINCEICKAKGYLCELCGNNEIIYPFDSCAMPCWKCNSIFHRLCWTKKAKCCPKCTRIERRQNETKIENDI
ncbi:differentially expressed in FDCP 8 homolog [Ctenocephalides felis]|uniref:differentially expressed in FDCP 8 homolog n=1 Tax=Ctenocephalides felis TaxID=7515 RepID=UPI000E6E5ABE|nr:differentially expressed in FDCP 8 homolog [Ctenocephalides felis]